MENEVRWHTLDFGINSRLLRVHVCKRFENAIFTFIFHSPLLCEKGLPAEVLLINEVTIPPGIIKLKNTTSAARKIYTYFASGATRG